jgi:hypothetical protein
MKIALAIIVLAIVAAVVALFSPPPGSLAGMQSKPTDNTTVLKGATRTAHSTVYELELFADEYQFYLQDDGARGDTASSDFWSDEALERQLAVDRDIVAVGTVRTYTLPVTVEVRDGAPNDSLQGWDLVSEVSMSISSGRLIVYGCCGYSPEDPRLSVAPGTYRLRAYLGGLGTVSTDETEGNDHYKVVLWPEKYAPPALLKEWSHP